MQAERFRILQMLYDDRHRPLQTISVEGLADQLEVSRELIWNELRYLKAKGYIALKGRALGTRMLYSIQLTATGVDVVEGKRITPGNPASGAETTRFPLRIFISHSHHDQDFGLRLLAFLKEHQPDTSVFYDSNTLRGGDNYMRAISEAIQQCPIFVVVLSPHAVTSNWVRQETDLALLLALDRPERQVIPIRHQECDIAQLSAFLSIRHIIDCAHQNEAQGFAQLLAAL